MGGCLRCVDYIHINIYLHTHTLQPPTPHRKNNKQNWQQVVKRGVHTLRHPEYQLIVVQPGFLTAAEMEAAKEIEAYDLL